MTGTPTDRHEPGRYAIRVQGRLESRWAAWFDGMTLTPEDDGTTTISGPVVDQAALHGLLRTIRDVGLPLVSVTPLDSQQPEAGSTRSAHPGRTAP